MQLLLYKGRHVTTDIPVIIHFHQVGNSNETKENEQAIGNSKQNQEGGAFITEKEETRASFYQAL